MPPPATLQTAATTLARAIRARQLSLAHPLVMAIDGRSGTGKSALALLLAPLVGAAVVPCDDFFAADIPAADWDSRSPSQRVDGALDWRRLRQEALLPLRQGRVAEWRPLDFAAGARADGTYRREHTPILRYPAAVIIVEGAYSARAELSDLEDLSVLVEAPAPVRQLRLAQREDPVFLAAWHQRWDTAEDHYFGELRPSASFDHVVVST